MAKNTTIRVEGQHKTTVMDIIEEELVKAKFKILIRDNIRHTLTVKMDETVFINCTFSGEKGLGLGINEKN
jgi:hypothetical protein